MVMNLLCYTNPSFDACRFAMSTKEELEANNDDCAICWEGMETARKLPCGHLFHRCVSSAMSCVSVEMSCV